MRLNQRFASAAVAVLLTCGPLAAQAQTQAPPQPIAPVVAVAPLPPVGKMDGKIKIRGQEIAYSGEAGEMVVTDAAGKPLGTMSFTSYVAKGKDAKARPVTFFYNGGPGAATVALREGLAPKVIEAGKPRGQWAIVDNPESLLDVSDLVFLDAPGTGLGRFYSADAKLKLWGVEQDAAAFAQVVEKWLKGHGRVGSPRYLFGESYGGVRSGFLAEYLKDKGLKVDRIVLVSPSTSAGGGNPLGNRDRAVLALPTQAAVARFHGKGAYTSQKVEDIAAKAETFALGDYSAALAKYDALTEAEKAAIAKQVSDFTGIPAEAILANKLRVTNFGDTLRTGERLGRDDGRLHASIEEMKKLPSPYDEPGSSMYTLTYDLNDAFTAQFADTFGYKPASTFLRYAPDVGGGWRTNQVSRGAVSIPLMFKEQMAADPKLKILMVGGYYDTTVPYVQAQSDYRAAALPAGRLEYHTYHSGHAVFSDPVSQKQAGDQIRAFYASK